MGQFSTKRAKMNHAQSFVRCMHGSSDYLYTYLLLFSVQKKNNNKWALNGPNGPNPAPQNETIPTKRKYRNIPKMGRERAHLGHLGPK